MTIERDQPGTTPTSRIAWFCERFEVEAPELQYETEEPHVGDVLLSDNLIDWSATNGISLDWLCFGDERGLVAAYRERELAARQTQAFTRITRQLEPEVKEGLVATLQAVVQLGVPLPEAMASFEEVVKEHRGKAAA